jgi:transcription termination factor NusB
VGISLEAIESYDTYIRVLVTASETLDFSIVEELVDDILTTFTENPNIPEAVQEATQDVLDAVLAGDSEQIQAEVENLLETFETLTEEEQAILQAEIEALIANSDIDFNALFNFNTGN